MKSIFKNMNDVKKSINVGDRIILKQADIAMQYDNMLPEYFDFAVTQKHPYVITLERKTLKNGIHRQSISYSKLMNLLNNKSCKVLKNEKI